MNIAETGKLIAKLRKDAGYTQASLAEALHITDKAVSKWERGICAPDSSLLPKLSMLFDTEIEYLIGGHKPYGEQKWVGEIRIKGIEGEIAGKPIIHYLISYFMLVGINDIYIKTDNISYVRNLHLEKYGLNISFFPFANDSTVIIYDKFFIFGANLTRYFQTYMNSGKNIIPVINGCELPIIFTHHPSFPLKWHRENCERRSFTRGYVCLPLNKEASDFVEIYERNCNNKIADLDEIAKSRGLI